MSDLVVRFHGPEIMQGHTVINDYGKFAMHFSAKRYF